MHRSTILIITNKTYRVPIRMIKFNTVLNENKVIINYAMVFVYETLSIFALHFL